MIVASEFSGIQPEKRFHDGNTIMSIRSPSEVHLALMGSAHGARDDSRHTAAVLVDHNKFVLDRQILVTPEAIHDFGNLWRKVSKRDLVRNCTADHQFEPGLILVRIFGAGKDTFNLLTLLRCELEIARRRFELPGSPASAVLKSRRIRFADDAFGILLSRLPGSDARRRRRRFWIDMAGDTDIGRGRQPCEQDNSSDCCSKYDNAPPPARSYISHGIAPLVMQHCKPRDEALFRRQLGKICIHVGDAGCGCVPAGNLAGY